MAKKIYNNLEEILGSVLLVGMCVVAVLQVASRYILREPFSWTEEVCTFMFVWLTFVGASLALKTGEHFAVEVIVDKLPGKFGWGIKICSCLLVTLFTVLIIWFGCRLTVNGWSSITPALEIPRSIPYAAVPVGGILMLIRAVENLFKSIKSAKLKPATEN